MPFILFSFLHFFIISFVRCETLMKDVEIKTNIPVKEQRLLFAGKQLEASKKLLEYGLQKASTLFLVLR